MGVSKQRKYRIIVIEPCLNGLILQIGCQRAVFTDYSVLCQELEKYYDDPEKMEEVYTARSWNFRGEAPVDPNPLPTTWAGVEGATLVRRTE